MPTPSKVSQLPEAVRTELQRRLIASGFSGYVELEEWLASQGYEIGKSSLQRDGAKLKRRLDAIRASTQAARDLAEAAPDDEGHLGGSVISMIQSDIFEVLLKLQDAQDEDVNPVERLGMLSAAAKSVAELSRASVGQKKWMVEVRAKVNAAAEAAAKIAKRGGLSADAVSEIRKQILGIGK